MMIIVVLSAVVALRVEGRLILPVTSRSCQIQNQHRRFYGMNEQVWVASQNAPTKAQIL